MYLKDGPKRLITDINNAKKQGFVLGIKLVRGAYLHLFTIFTILTK